MKVINARNVNDAYRSVITDALKVDENWRIIAPRQGEVTLEYKGPVTTIYRNPWERVLFNSVRDANPFFHLMEALWMLRGRDDVEFVSHFSKNIANYSDDGLTFHGAYGRRWRWWNNTQDQVSGVIQHLIANPDSRRAVIAMWDPTQDLNSGSLDLPCNTHIYFKVRDDDLYMTVCNRSNDVIWGCYGANAVHFSILQEYIAACIDAGIGTYTHISDSFHIYTSNPAWKGHQKVGTVSRYGFYETIHHPHFPLVMEPSLFDNELDIFFRNGWEKFSYEEPFFSDVAVPMRKAWDVWKKDRNKKDYTYVMGLLEHITAADWKTICKFWMRRRYNRD